MTVRVDPFDNNPEDWPEEEWPEPKEYERADRMRDEEKDRAIQKAHEVIEDPDPIPQVKKDA